MRIISGKYKGRRINPPSGLKVRPTTDFAKESLFDILSNRVDFEDIEVLDLFSGTGSISFEFASRGTKNVHLVEFDRYNLSFIRKVVHELNFKNIKPLHIDVQDYLRACRYHYDIVFADPPYNLLWLTNIPDLVIESNVLKEDGFLILEHPASVSFTGNPYFFEHRKYGKVNFSFFRKHGMSI
ncbi:MAG TPA: RsmD family RNA methyltransferase [Bacteroidales bacterium]|nr:16S rRNA (guanine(966)-N(2))-methyltransferase RsmD [Bacteroidales bacterium]HRC88573.1 RsmD family RNA methyltransferase [Bacteroidales bacterium]